MTRLLVPLLLLASEIHVEGPEDLIPRYRERVAALLPDVERGLGFTFDGVVIVRLARTESEFRRLAGERGDWVVAVARPSEGVLVVRLPAVGAARGTDVSSVLRHELVHLLLPARLDRRARLPLWFEEGLAQVIGGRVNRSDAAQVAVAEDLGALIPLEELERSFPVRGAVASLAYAQGESVVAFIVDAYGRAGLHRLLTAVRDTGSLDAALRRVHGFGVRDLERRWKEWLAEEEDPWWFVLLTGSTITILLFVASLLVVAAFLRARRRARATYESLPE
ncbi:MAG: peptidase MA family metallohydrolase [Planctomycetota bacterium]|jgi:hypothetical protein